MSQLTTHTMTARQSTRNQQRSISSPELVAQRASSKDTPASTFFLSDVSTIPIHPKDRLAPSAMQVGSLVDRALAGGGAPLSDTVRVPLERQLHYDFSQVRIHSDPVAAASARAIGADAYTIGTHIVLDGDPGMTMSAGRRILVHELVHVLQQGVSLSTPRALGHAGTAAEQQAVDVAERIANDKPLVASLLPEPVASGTVQRQEAREEHFHLLDQPARVGHGMHLLDRQLDIGSADRADFDAIRKMGIATMRGRRITTLEDYLSVRRAEFGAPGDSSEAADAKYWAFAAESDAELDADSRLPPRQRLRSMIEPGLTGDQEVQAHFYRWVRRAFKKGGVEDVPGAIKRGMRLGGELRGIVRAEWKGLGHHEALDVQGPNPRPQKAPQTLLYELGTLSEHAKGAAVDIDPGSNPFFSKDQWSQIERVAGTRERRDPKVWKELWRANPRELWSKIKTINDAFVVRLLELARDEELRSREFASRHHLIDPARLRAPIGHEGAMLEPPHPPEKLSLGPLFADRAAAGPSKQAFQAVLGNHPELERWRAGFFTLDADLVERLAAHGLVWGATFDDRVDLQHFEFSAAEVRHRKGAER
jgi:Domain of unknown function (DUF4157)